MTVELRNGFWLVMERGRVVAGPFISNCEAWRWVDRYEGEPISRSEKTAQFLFDRKAGLDD
jgi:hypothetical protein